VANRGAKIPGVLRGKFSLKAPAGWSLVWTRGFWANPGGPQILKIPGAPKLALGGEILFFGRGFFWGQCGGTILGVVVFSTPEKFLAPIGVEDYSRGAYIGDLSAGKMVVHTERGSFTRGCLGGENYFGSPLLGGGTKKKGGCRPKAGGVLI